MDKLLGMIDKTLPVEAQVIQAEQLAQELMNGACASLYDITLASTLREAFVLPSVERLTAELRATYSGGKLQEVILQKLTAPLDKARKWFEPGACFAAGTLVHTREGLVPIEQIKVGDWVLSKPENGRERAYKRVVKTFALAPERVIEVRYHGDGNQKLFDRITCTANHPFWVDELGWTSAENLYRNWTRENWLELADGRNVRAYGTRNIYVSDQSGVGWLPAHSGAMDEPGNLWDYVNHRLVAHDVMALQDVQDHEEKFHDPRFYTFPDELFLKLPVYNLEVEDFHTYYVGKHGVWVHNANCGGLGFEVKAPGPVLSKQMAETPFLTRKELLDYLKKNNIHDGTFLIRADGQSQAGLMATEDIPKWLDFEEGVFGRVTATDGSRWEYAVVYFDEAAQQSKFIRVEGLELSPKGLQIYIDRKLAFIKANHVGEVMQLLSNR
jgi:hypothetical protein